MHSVVHNICDDIMNIDVMNIDEMWYCLKVLLFKCVTGVMGPGQRHIHVAIILFLYISANYV